MKYINGENLTKAITPQDLSAAAGNSITLPACVYQIRKGAGFSFVILRSGRYLFQAVYVPQVCKTSISCLCEGAYINASGKVKEEKRAPFGIEITLTDFYVISKPETDFPIPFSDNALHCSVETNLKNRSITLRRPDQRAVLKISEGIIQAFSDFMYKNDFTRIEPPAVCKAETDERMNTFRLKYFGEEARLSANKHIYTQAGVAFFDRVFSISDVFRADKHNSTRHLNEFTSLDFEFGFINNVYDIINTAAALLRHITDSLNANRAYELELCGCSLPDTDQILTLTFSEAAQLLGLKTDRTDLDPTDCRYICEYAKKQGSDFVFVTHFPSEKCPFYFMDSDDNPKFCESFVLLFDGLEIAGGGQKIHSYSEQITKLENRGLSPNDYSDFLELHKYALPPHGGCSIGLERLTMKLLKLENIKLASLFPRDMHHLSL